MDHSAHSPIMDANSSVVATSSDETLFLSSTGDVLVCRDFDYQDDRHAINTDRADIVIHDIGRLQNGLDDFNILESSSKDEVARNLWGQPHQRQDDEFSCCDANTSCHSTGLCGGAESSSNQYGHNNSMGTNAKPKRGRYLNSNTSSSATNTTHERGVAYIHSSDSSGRKGLSIKTSRSDDEEYDNVDINGVNLRDHDEWITVGTNSPTPVMSFDYSCYEPPTPEASRSYDHEEDKHLTSSRIQMNGHGNKSSSMPNLTNGLEKDHIKDTINLPTGSTVPMHKQTFESHPIHPRTQPNKSQEKHSSAGTIYNGNFPGIPTFLGHLSQIRITQISAHPSGHHVLLASVEGMLFSYGSNDRGQLGLGRQHTKVTAPQLITPLLENGGKTINCAAGLDYSLVVVKTEGSRIAHRRRQQQRSPKSTMLNERNAHQQVYAFGCNDNNKLGLLDPEKSLKNNYSGEGIWRRWRKDAGDSSPIESPEPPSPSSHVSGDDSTNDGSASSSSDVYLPRRVALHCKVIPKRDSAETPIHNNRTAVASIPFGIFCIAASKDHSAALVKRPSRSVELYTWGRGEDGRLGLPVPGSTEPLTPTSRWDTLCCASMDNDDETLNSLIDDGSSLGFDVNDTHSNQSAMAQYFVPKPSMVTSLSMLASEKAKHPPLPMKSKFLPRPRKNQRGSPSKYDANCLLAESEHAVRLALGPRCTHVITSTGQWFAFGSSSDGLLAAGGHVSNIYQPTEVKLPLAFGHETISSISIGETHGIALTTTGRAFTWGTSPDGALGRGNKSYMPIPQPVSLRKSTHSTVFNSAITSHLRGECSNPRSRVNIGGEGVTADAGAVAYVHAGKDLSVFILRSGSIQTCGRQSGRLGQGDVSMCVSSPTEIYGGVQMWRGEKSP